MGWTTTATTAQKRFNKLQDGYDAKVLNWKGDVQLDLRKDKREKVKRKMLFTGTVGIALTVVYEGFFLN